MLSRRTEFIAGVKAELPILLGVSPFGLIYGVLALSAGLPAALAFAMSSVVFAGSAQFVGAPLLGSGAPAIVVITWRSRNAILAIAAGMATLWLLQAAVFD